MNNPIKTVRVSLRLPPALHKRLRERAKHEHRSLHSQIIWLLSNTVATREMVALRADALRVSRVKSART
jgi:hypothetical protein